MANAETTPMPDDHAVTDDAPPWIKRQLTGLLQQRGHAWLLAGPSGLGQFRLGLEMVRAWLCDQPSDDRGEKGEGGHRAACGVCQSCHAIDVHAHTDLLVLMPETILLELGWPLSEDAQKKIDDKERKPSKEIRVDALRDAVEFAQRTSGRGRGKAVLVYPAERMNHISANTLLKTLEEPPGDLKFVLASESAQQLLPTIRSRCLAHSMVWPEEGESMAWLASQGVPAAQAATLLRAAGGRPEDARDYYAQGLPPAAWEALPKAMQRGDLATFKDWTAPQVVDALHKLCHDLVCVSKGAAPRFFAAASLPKSGNPRALDLWAKSLGETRRTVEHPFNAGLMLESLVAEAKTAINSRP